MYTNYEQDHYENRVLFGGGGVGYFPLFEEKTFSIKLDGVDLPMDVNIRVDNAYPFKSALIVLYSGNNFCLCIPFDTVQKYEVLENGIKKLTYNRVVHTSQTTHTVELMEI